ncbi:MAG: SpoIID/LytB domain-containing protein, partial [Rhodothermales bacterium]|nr:SpoIID/LytB domain-containing protein [Rhodothermales bacterium]
DSIRILTAAIGLRVETGLLDINLDRLHARPEAEGAVDVQIRSSGQATTRRYPGDIGVSRTPDGSMKITNTVPLELYVASVVGKEYGLDDEEGTRAMAIVARTFAVRALLEEANTGDGISSQVYHGLDGISDASLAAANATRGIVLTHDDRPILSVYSASNGGHSARNSDVWSGAPLPYLDARRDRFDRAASPYNDWLSRLSRSQVHAALSDMVGASVSGFSIESRSKDGRVKTIRVKIQDADDAEISGSEFRRALSGRFGVSTLRSTLFDVSREGDHYVFEGSGYGHGVGLSQWGAHEMASRGYNYEEILRFYYTGTKTRPLTDLGFAPSESPALAETRTEEGKPQEIREEKVAERPRRGAAGLRGWGSTAQTPAAATGRRVGW